MKVFKKVQKRAEVVVDVTCNECGDSCRNTHFTEQVFDFTSLDFRHTGNFGSKFDDVTHFFRGRIHLCDTCCIKLLARLSFLPATPGFPGRPSADGDWIGS